MSILLNKRLEKEKKSKEKKEIRRKGGRKTKEKDWELLVPFTNNKVNLYNF